MGRSGRGQPCSESHFHRIGPASGSCYKGAASRSAGYEMRLAMGFPVRLCALVGRFSDPRVAESVSVLIPHLLSRQVKVIVSEETPFSGDTAGILRMPEKDIGTQADLVIAIG